MKPTLILREDRLVIAGDLALSVAQWTLTGTGTDGNAVHMEGTTSDVLRQQAEGRWLFVIDNPWGAGISVDSGLIGRQLLCGEDFSIGHLR